MCECLVTLSVFVQTRCLRAAVFRPAAPRPPRLPGPPRGSAPLQDLAEALGADKTTVQGWETGRRPLTSARAGNVIALRTELLDLGADPALVDGLVEEVIRWVTPLNNMFRRARTDDHIGDQPVAEGEAVKVGDKFGIRLTSLRLPGERFKPVKRR